MQYYILSVFLPLCVVPSFCAGGGTSEGTGGHADADVYRLSPAASETSDQSLRSNHSTQDKEDSSALDKSEHHARDGEDPLATVMAERNDLRARLAQKNHEYIAQYRMAQKLGILYSQEQQKYGRLQKLLQNTLRKLTTFQRDFESLDSERNVLENAVETAAAVSPLNASSATGLDVAPLPEHEPTGLNKTASQGHSLARKEELGPHAKPGIGHLRSGRRKTSSPTPIPDNDRISSAAGSAEREHPAALRAHSEDVKLDPQMRDEDEQILILDTEQSADEE